MDEALQKLLDALGSNSVVTLVVIGFLSVTLTVLRNLDAAAMFRYWVDRRRKETEHAKELVQDSTLPEQLRMAIQESIERQIFRQQFGISTYRAMRDALIEMNQKHPDTATWQTLGHLSHYIQLTDGHLSIEIGWMAKVEKYYMYFTAGLLLLYSLMALGLGVHLAIAKSQGLPELVILGMLLGAAAALIMYATRPYRSADAIKKLLEKEASRHDASTAPARV